MIAISMFTSGNVAIWSLVLCGFFNSIMFPNIFTLGIAGLGPMTSKGSGLIMTAVVGGAVIPYLIGALADKVGIQHAFVIPDHLLPLHRLLRAVGIEAYADDNQLEKLSALGLTRRAFALSERSLRITAFGVAWISSFHWASA